MLANKEAGFTGRATYANGNVLLIVKKDGKMRTVKLLPNGVTVPHMDIKIGAGVGVGIRYDVDGGAVLAIRRPIKARSGGYEEVVYTSFSEAINSKQLRAKGLRHLEEKLENARTFLRENRIMSKSYPSKNAADVVEKDVALLLAIVEHIDPARFKRAQQDGSVRKLVDEVLVTVGANGEIAYRYSVSEDNARSLFQFIPRTYASVVRNYPKANLIPDHVEGMNDHSNGAIAALLLFDLDLACTSRNYREFARKNPAVMGRYLAAAYNGGAPATKSAIARHGSKWQEHLCKEARNYVDKYDAVSRILNL